MQVAIDGPASAGKSTVAKIIAKKLSFVYIDTGAMYRACTVIARDNKIDYGDEDAILKAIDKTGIEFKAVNGEQKVYAGNKDISLEIRTPEISANVSQVSALAGVRKKMVSLQRKMAGQTNVIMDGRDIGTTVLPNAEVKIFLVASAHSRAQRRLLDLKQRGIHSDKTVDEIEKDIANRDYKDSHRKISPLKKASDAIKIDTTNMTIDQVVDTILKKIKEKAKKL
ncbi:(d)CMP kinase [Lactobacillus acetotolerans]|jgi:cytidylate kinase|uniref:Cytidylate kinase n=4 Tax=Lactobacillus acetotolerans TaxID=1600 RepID=A0A353UBS0_9LACO|nr:(d)CMP kinase [Lactobacillus acetotolerans]KRN41861.1 cytidylate kinase [Lactobacillus acetotolerans DSM 20749 = JCM 3825]QFG51351.1 (d)CMP kinase [Lactobacillus acetotolerans]QGV04536.1 (d)CMP kinase [Lactobacillus acetotolerans]QJD73648.1 (d)CMP kinase [Lactobacillus acetotolerans]GGV09758.1 cytidylate kinase [Lactobacillus acetotolerans DSM 20749 = JCM 3825]